MKKKINVFAVLVMLFLPSGLWAFATCPSCGPGFVCTGVSVDGCCWSGCSSSGSGGGACSGVFCGSNQALNLTTCKCEDFSVVCLAGEYKLSETVCAKCPSLSGCVAKSPGEGTTITGCYVSNCGSSDKTGSYTFTQKCNYSR